MDSVFRLVEAQRDRAVDMSTDPGSGTVGAFGRAEDVVHDEASARPDHAFAPLRPDQLPPPVLRDRPQLVAALRQSLVPCLLRAAAQFAVLLEAVAVVHQFGEPFVEVFQRRGLVDALPGAIRRQTILPDLVEAFDLAFDSGALAKTKEMS